MVILFSGFTIHIPESLMKHFACLQLACLYFKPGYLEWKIPVTFKYNAVLLIPVPYPLIAAHL